MARIDRELQFILKQRRICFDLTEECGDREIAAALKRLAAALADAAARQSAREALPAD